MWKKKGTQIENAQATASSPTEVHLGLSRSKLSEFFRRKRLVLIVGIVVVAGLCYGTWWTVDYIAKRNVPSREIPSQADYLSNALTTLQANPPAQSADDATKAAYYNDLTLTYADQKNYQKAIEAFKQREAITSKSIEYHHYMNAAEYYAAVGDKHGALAMINKAEAAMPANDDESKGFYRDEILGYIQQMRQEYSQ